MKFLKSFKERKFVSSMLEVAVTFKITDKYETSGYCVNIYGKDTGPPVIYLVVPIINHCCSGDHT